MTLASRTLFFAPDTRAAHDLVAHFAAAGLTIDHLSVLPTELDASALCIVDARGEPAALELCRQLRQRSPHGSLLAVIDDLSPTARAAVLAAGADRYLPYPFLPSELAVHLAALARERQQTDRLSRQTTELQQAHERLGLAYRQAEREVVAAGRLHRALLPTELPQARGFDFAVWGAGGDRVGGDAHGWFAIDEDHLGLYLADVIGPPVRATLLTALLRERLRPNGPRFPYSVVSPDQVLRRVNHDLGPHLASDDLLLGVVYLVLNHRTGSVRWARAGQPLPLVLPADGPPAFWPANGALMGGFEGDFPLRTNVLHPGDQLLLVSDGLLHFLHDEPVQANARLLRAASECRGLPLTALLSRLENDLRLREHRADDFTLVGLERLPTR